MKHNTFSFGYTVIANFELDIDELARKIVEENPDEDDINYLLEDFGDNLYNYLEKLGFPGDWDSIDESSYDYIYESVEESLEESLKLLLFKNEEL